MSIKQKTKALNECLDEVFKVIEELSEDLEKIEAKEGHSERFARFKRFQVQRIINAVNAFEAYQEETSLAYKLLADQNKNLREEIDKLQVICLWHGITDGEILVMEDFSYLLSQMQFTVNVLKAYKIPIEIFTNGVNEDLPCSVDKRNNQNRNLGTTLKPVTSFKGLTFKDFYKNGEEQSK